MIDQQLPEGWEPVAMENGQVYYYSKALDRTQWERPTSANASSTASTTPNGAMSSSLGVDLESQQKLGTRLASAYCDISDVELQSRLLCPLTPHQALMGASDTALADLMERPDFIGPFWVCVTVGLTAFASNHIEQWLYSRDVVHTYVGTLPFAWCLLIFWCVISPLVLRYLYHSANQNSNDFNLPVGLFKLDSLICAYGYSLVTAIPALLLASAPSVVLRITFLLASMLCGLAFLTACLKK
ncbi:WW domain protein [Gregarina niphandrodes]|uniref:WW domain protein n=1 Tax=Gregarina niphandrodes TaxID=110365 RepID=A0A023B894_GRENI|nr:WW domain protein [Gregarina niphandrodes]EZG68308.1 WW domain protein [Gregarina niphandrodes]|eukprot:XP_011134594.1 WW domain protein [Gregarina niphandrodes]